MADRRQLSPSARGVKTEAVVVVATIREGGSRRFAVKRVPDARYG